MKGDDTVRIKHAKGPQFLRFIIPIIDVLRELGGSGTAADVTDLVVDRMKFTENELNEKIKSGPSRIRNQIAWARMYLVIAGLVDSSGRGVWKLTEKGFSIKLDQEQVFELFRKVQDSFKVEKSTVIITEVKSKQEEFDAEVPYEAYKSELIRILQKMSPSGFEKIMRRLLSELGLRQVEVTGKPGDKGIDGIGLLEVNELVKFKVFFQCKRFENSVGAGHIRDFRGALSGRADKGIFLTTGYFTPESKKEATRDGVVPIELVDGERLVELFEKNRLGLTSKIIFEVNHDFFKQFE